MPNNIDNSADSLGARKALSIEHFAIESLVVNFHEELTRDFR